MTNEDAIKWLKDIERSFSEAYFGDWRESLRMAIQALEAQPKKGKWIDVLDEIITHSETSYSETHHNECSICKCCISGWLSDGSLFKYCPNCGAEMEEEDGKETN